MPNVKPFLMYGTHRIFFRVLFVFHQNKAYEATLKIDLSKAIQMLKFLSIKCNGELKLRTLWAAASLVHAGDASLVAAGVFGPIKENDWKKI